MGLSPNTFRFTVKHRGRIIAMSLYQSSVLNKYLAAQDKEAIKAAYSKFSAYFLNKKIQENIRSGKEEQFQEGFLRELFVNVLGYTIHPEDNHNLTTELKNINDAKKTDGAILKSDGNALAVIELKGTDTKDLSKVNEQAFSYKNNHPDCVYVITSNFEKLRFFINDIVNLEEFNLFSLTEERFALLWLFLQKDNLLGGIPLKIKEESLLEDEKITKALYADYSAFKNDLWDNMVNQNPQYDPLLLYKKCQKLLDRFLFIFFAEDKGLLPPNLISKVVDRWKLLKREDAYKPMYDIFKQYFGYMNDGYKGTDYYIEAYNGGLFKADELLDNLTISDEILEKHTLKLTRYDFDDEVDTNILGHIFEHSLNDIENVRAQLAGEKVDKSKSKRKKDGVFYTPKYITKYIVDNTVGRLCEEKKAEIGIDDEEFAKGRKGRKKATIEKLDAQLKKYREWLLQLTICDPACGSGAFLNQALEFLIAEHRYLDELEAALHEGNIVFPNVENHILENNIYGVDINEESVEIARLSLWLRTAKKGRKLTSLSSNIKVGNSLIDDPEVAGELAFNWQEEFPKVFAKGGFDVVIGNPPWGARIDEVCTSWLLKKYPTVPSKLKDSYMYFQLFSIKILKPLGLLGLIVPNTWLLINNASEFRQNLLSFDVFEITDYGDAVFEDAIVESATIFLRNIHNKNGKVLARKYRGHLELANQRIDKSIWLDNQYCRIVVEIDLKTHAMLKRIELTAQPFEETSEIIFGIKPYQVGHGKPPQTKEVVSRRIYHSNDKISEDWKPLVVGSDVNRYHCEFHNNEYIKYGEWLMYKSNEGKISAPKILLRRTSSDIKAALDLNHYYPQNSIFIVTSSLNLKYLLAILNSKLLSRIYQNKCPQVGKVFAEVKPSIIKSLPIANPKDPYTENLMKMVDEILLGVKELRTVTKGLLSLLESKYDIEKPSKKLQNWPSLHFKGFLAELKKAKVPKLSLAEEAEWMAYFNKKKTEANELQSEIDRIDKEIDQMVYQLYGLTEEEIKIVENS